MIRGWGLAMARGQERGMVCRLNLTGGWPPVGKVVGTMEESPMDDGGGSEA